MAHALSEETLIEIDDMLDDIQSLRDVSPDSVTRAIKVLLQEVRRQREDQYAAPIDERLPVDQPFEISNFKSQISEDERAVGLADSTHPTQPPF